ncbi:hypothetical protein BLNAU_17210 [Blattamonas nauphoetae]|nr:hypothetical protein BLNAU_17210 [Blattamonas nauphoetae]
MIEDTMFVQAYNDATARFYFDRLASRPWAIRTSDATLNPSRFTAPFSIVSQITSVEGKPSTTPTYLTQISLKVLASTAGMYSTASSDDDKGQYAIPSNAMITGWPSNKGLMFDAVPSDLNGYSNGILLTQEVTSFATNFRLIVIIVTLDKL